MENPHSLGLCAESIDSYYGFCYSNMLQILFESQLYAQICVQQKHITVDPQTNLWKEYTNRDPVTSGWGFHSVQAKSIKL